jgi:hypothetical protein
MTLPKTLLEWTQLFALLLAGTFFLVKLGQGWLMVNLSLSGNAKRTPKGDGFDALAVTVTLTKGSIGSVKIHDTDVLVRWSDGSKRESLKGTSRIATSPSHSSIVRLPWQSSPPYHIVRPWMPPAKRPLYRLPPGESTAWSCVLSVPTEAICVIEAIVIGTQWPNWYPGQWHCSLISLPAEKSLSSGDRCWPTVPGSVGADA